MESAAGLKLPQLAARASATITVTVHAISPLPGDVQRINFALGSAVDPTLKFDAVQAVSLAVSPSAPDLAALNLAWNAAVGGLDFAYSNAGTPLTNSTTATIVWASGPALNDIIPGPAIYAATIPAGFSDQATLHLAESYFQSPPANALDVQLVLDPDNLVAEQRIL
jgi:hypothetical protein